MVVRLHIETRRRFAAPRRCSVAHAIVRTHGDTHRRDEHRPVRELPAAALAHHCDVVHQRLWLRPTGRRSLWQFCRPYTDSSASPSLPLVRPRPQNRLRPEERAVEAVRALADRGIAHSRRGNSFPVVGSFGSREASENGYCGVTLGGHLSYSERGAEPSAQRVGRQYCRGRVRQDHASVGREPVQMMPCSRLRAAGDTGRLGRVAISRPGQPGWSAPLQPSPYQR